MTSALRAPRTDRGRRTRESVLDAARSVFERQGFAATTMSDIAEAAGVSHGTVYTYFPTKEDLLATIVEELVADLGESIRALDLSDPVLRLASANERYLNAYTAHAQLLRVVEEVATSDVRFSQILDELRRAHVQRVAVQIARQQQAGVARADVPAQTAAAALCAMVEGFGRYWATTQPTAPADVTTLNRLWVGALGFPRQHVTNEEGPDGVHR